jgi:DNA-binding response OmpR family regulator
MTPPVESVEVGSTPLARRAGRVLIADDYPDSAESLALLLDMRGFETATVADGGDVIATVDKFKPDVVILDLIMPGCDGEAIARELLNRNRPERPRVIVTTGVTDEPRRSRLAEIGVDVYLLKPTEPTELLSHLHEFCPIPAELAG